jgi:hypothetical protein
VRESEVDLERDNVNVIVNERDAVPESEKLALAVGESLEDALGDSEKDGDLDTVCDNETDEEGDKLLERLSVTVLLLLVDLVNETVDDEDGVIELVNVKFLVAD